MTRMNPNHTTPRTAAHPSSKPQSAIPNPQSQVPPARTSDIRHPTSLPPLSPEDKDRLSLLYRTRADFASFAALRTEDPLDLLAWLHQPHIQPWRDAILAVYREHQ